MPAALGLTMTRGRWMAGAQPEAAGYRGTAVSFLPEWEGAPATKATTDIGDLTVIWPRCP